MSEPIRVLFVCLGNICRSPTAEATFRAEVERRGLMHRFEIDSCGTGGWHAGEAAHPETRAAAKRAGVEITHRARQLLAEDFDSFDHLLVMDHSNHKNTLALVHSDAQRAKVTLFRTHDPEAQGSLEVPDPYYTGTFDEVFEMCARTSRALLDDLLR